MSASRPTVLVVDNYDSFVFNLVQYLGQLGAECVVRRNDEVGARDAAGVDGVLLSPGHSLLPTPIPLTLTQDEGE